MDFITPLLGVMDINRAHINIDWTSGGLEALNPKDMVRRVSIAEVTGSETPEVREEFL